MEQIGHRELFKNLIRYLPRNMALDVGTGQGQSAFFLTNFFLQVVGIDICEDCIKTGRRAFFRHRKILKLKVMDGAALRFPQAVFDCVTGYWLFHHLRFLARVLSEIHRVLKPDGIFFGVDHLDQKGNPKQNNYLELHKLKIEVERRLGKDHFDLIPPETMVEELKKAGFTNINFKIFLTSDQDQKELTARVAKMVQKLKTAILQLELHSLEYQKRLEKIEQEISRQGVEFPPYYAIYGFKPKE